MALSRALKMAAAFRSPVKKGPDVSMTNPSQVKGKAIKTYDNSPKGSHKKYSGPNYAQDNNNQSTAKEAGKVKLII